MITCSRCGKENQDLYKFCLGCGDKLQAAPVPAAVAPPLPAPTPEQLHVEVATPATPPHSGLASGLAPVLGGAGGLGINLGETNDSGLTPPPEAGTANRRISTPATPNLPAGARPSARLPMVSSPISAPSVQIGLGSIPMQVPTRPNPLGRSVAPAGQQPSALQPAVQPSTFQIDAPTPLPVAPASTPSSRPSPFSPPTVDTVVCPTCGKMVASAFAFCGGCGHRMKPAPGAIGDSAAQRAEAVAAAPIQVAPRGHLTLIRPDGTEGGVFPLLDGNNSIGRGQGPLFDADPYLSPSHAEFQLAAGGLSVRDQRSLNGVFVRITEEELIESGDSFRIGQELLRFDVINPPTPLEDGTEIVGTPNPGYWGRLSVIVGRDVDGPAFPLFDETAMLGRERGDILFPEDGYVSGAHCQISLREGRVYLKDLGSSNGSFLRVRESRIVPSGSLMLMGQQLFRVAYT